MTKTKYALLTAVSLLAFQAQAETLKEMKISGTRRIENAAIMNYTGLKTGQEVSHADLDQATKTLFATGLFADVDIQMNEGIASVKVTENPIVQDIYFEGNKALDDDVLKTEIMLKPRAVYTKTKLQKDANRLQSVYQRSGRFAAVVEPKIIQKAQNRVDIVFEIKEGEDTSNVYLIKDDTLFLLYGRKDFEKMTSRKYEYIKGLNGHTEIALYVDTFEEVDAEYEKAVSKGAVSVLAPETEPWGQRTCYIADPEGNLIEIGSFNKPFRS